MAGELPAQEPDEKPGAGAGVGLMLWRDLDVLGVVAGVPVCPATIKTDPRRQLELTPDRVVLRGAPCVPVQEEPDEAAGLGTDGRVCQ
jgi:hypothetical protein